MYFNIEHGVLYLQIKQKYHTNLSKVIEIEGRDIYLYSKMYKRLVQHLLAKSATKSAE